MKYSEAMTNNNATKNNHSNDRRGKRTSPQKQEALPRKTKSFHYVEKKNEIVKASNSDEDFVLAKNENEKGIFLDDTTLLTPEAILQTYVTKKKSCTDLAPVSTPQNESLPQQGQNILELLSKKDKQASSCKEQENVAIPPSKCERTYSSPVKATTNSKVSPPITPRRTSSERFAGLSNSPAPNNLPLPSFKFDQELNKPTKEMVDIPDHIPPPPFNANPAQPQSPFIYPPMQISAFPMAHPSMPIPAPLPPTSRGIVSNNSPPSNPHLDQLSSHLRMMLNIAPIQS